MYDDKDQEIEDLRLLVATYDIQLDRYEKALRELRNDCDRLEIQVKRFQDEIKQHVKDWCDDDEAIKQQALRVLPKESVEGDSVYVPRMGALAEMMADEIIKLRNSMKDSFDDLTIDQINTLYNSLCKEDCSKPTPKIPVKSLPSKMDTSMG